MDPNAPPTGFMGGVQNTMQTIGQGLGNLFPGYRDAPRQGGETDPFSGLSRNQRMLLGFAALRDAAASLQGEQSDFFTSALGGFEQGRERERLRQQGMFQNRVQAAQALAMIQQQIILGQSLRQDVSGLQAMADQIQAGLMDGFGGALPAVPTGTGAVLPAVTGTPAVSSAGGAAGTRPLPGVMVDAQGNLVGEYTGEEEAALPAAEPVAPAAEPAAPSVFNPASFTTVEDVDAAMAQLSQENSELSQRPAISAGGITIDPTDQIQTNMDIIERLQERRDQLEAAQAGQEAQEGRQSLFVEQIPAAVNAFAEYLTPDGQFINTSRQAAYTANMGADTYQFRALQGALAPLAAVQAFESVADARAAGYTGTLTDTDIRIISGVGGVLDAANPLASIQTLRQIYQHPDLSDEARRLMNIPPEWAAAWGGPQTFTLSDDDRSLVEQYLGGQ
jgi:hypothetical protein